MSEYKKSGVDIDAGNRFVDLIRPFIKQTERAEVLGGIGGFGGFFRPDLSSYREPVLVSGTDGVGTKLRLAMKLQKFDTIGQDLVAMCVNDVICSGADPLFFLDYLATGRLDHTIHMDVVKGIAKACTVVGCSLIGGETAEMPGCYHDAEFDLAGFAVGIVDRSHIIDGSAIKAGDLIFGIESSGLHSNGFSLVNRLIDEGKLEADLSLLKPTRLYAPLIPKLIKRFSIHGIAHITGGGFWDNIPRIIPKELCAVIDRHSWKVPDLFRQIQQTANMSDDELYRVFNCGIGLIVVIPPDTADELQLALQETGWKTHRIGRIDTNQRSCLIF